MIAGRRSLVALALCTVAVTACSASTTASVVATSPANSVAPSAEPSPSPSPLAADWTEYHGDSARAGRGPDSPALTTPRVAWGTNLDGAVYASPLIVAGHVILATENNTVYSLDLYSGGTVWSTHLGAPILSRTLPCGDIGPVTGITGTPAADTATQRLYVVAFVQGLHHILFALSLVDGRILGQQDVDPPGSDPAVQQERSALSLGSGFVYVPLGGLYGDCGPYHGYLVAVPMGFGPVRTYRVPSSREAGFWSAMGATIDAAGDVYVVSGNGASLSTFDYSDSVIELTFDLQKVKSYFAPSDWVALNAEDRDLGSVGATLLPDSATVVSVGKDGVAYSLRADKLGGIGGQIAQLKICSGSWGGTAWQGTTVYVPCADGMVAISVAGSTLHVLWHQPRPRLASPIITAGAIWGIEPQTGTLYALDPASGRVLYTVGLGGAEHFSTPAATEGFVVAPAGSRVITVSTIG